MLWRFGTVSIDGTFAIKQFCYFVIHCMNATCALWPVYLNLRKVISLCAYYQINQRRGNFQVCVQSLCWCPNKHLKGLFLELWI